MSSTRRLIRALLTATLSLAVMISSAPSVTATTALVSTIHAYDVASNRFVGTIGSVHVGTSAQSPHQRLTFAAADNLPADGADVVAAETAGRVPGVIRAGDLKLPGVPKGAVGTATENGKGLEYAIPRGTPEIDPASEQRSDHGSSDDGQVPVP